MGRHLKGAWVKRLSHREQCGGEEGATVIDQPSSYPQWMCSSPTKNWWLGSKFRQARTSHQCKDFRFLTLVPVVIWPESNRRFSLGWNHQPRLESPAQWIVLHTFAAGTFSSGLWFKPGLKVAFSIPVGTTNRDQRSRWPFILGFGSNRDYRLIL